ncbi:PTS lactose/cellobiose transporter subunit IIA [Lentilactobacillus sp. SPB1-3]|uniref:PTS lactose/cellobiose transporter subunit IIA n=1 Tax=Lentilactobacillus terminaliae TaxID=3003483 RepID=A0ACD5DGY7_9LACO|nr:PTS lactose/cellobiose transporter subunit IIA [Lentilactobacillus sp. SPB1-3]MCZ0976858.1 PTS lactose/cellobiose transporter subunit IIA [Lentilactobacillus sp. SPB1-3]
MNKDDIIKVAMMMLTKAGNAKNELNQALDELANDIVDGDEAIRHMQTAHEFIVEAHKLQNSIIKFEPDVSYSMLLTHAQDTLMNVETIEFITKKITKIQIHD